MEDSDKRFARVLVRLQANLAVPVESIEDLINSEFSDVFWLLACLLGTAQIISDLMFDLLIDEEPIAAASQTLYNKRVEGWQKICKVSQHDDSGIQRTAAYGLLSDFGK